MLLIIKITFNISAKMVENKIIPILLMAFACLNMMALKTQKGSWITLYLITLANPKIVACSSTT